MSLSPLTESILAKALGSLDAAKDLIAHSGGSPAFQFHASFGAGASPNSSIINPVNTFNNILSVEEHNTGSFLTDYTTGISQELLADPSADCSGDVFGIVSDVGTAVGNTHNFDGTIAGMFNDAYLGGAGNVGQMFGALVGCYVQGGASGNVSKMAGMLVTEMAHGGSGTITNYYSLNVGAAFTYSSGTVVNNYGIFIEDCSLETNPGTGTSLNFNLYSDGATTRNCFLGKVWVGTSAGDASAKLQVDSTTQGVLLPRMTTTQKGAISSPAEGLAVWDTTLHALCVYNGSAWKTVTAT